VLEGLGNEAREAKKGLWADPQLVPQWEGEQATDDVFQQDGVS
jgi:endonuclease YncB( thermonuclease family)